MNSVSSSRPDLSSRADIEQFVDRFYTRLLQDPVLAAIFIDVAQINLRAHLPLIQSYWCKLLLGESGYHRHTMNIHRALHTRRPLEPADFSRWLGAFVSTVDQDYAGPQAEKAKRIAHSIAVNMRARLEVGVDLPLNAS
jgi:hemoglobin